MVQQPTKKQPRQKSRIAGKIFSKVLQWSMAAGLAAFKAVLLMLWMLIKATVISALPQKIKKRF